MKPKIAYIDDDVKNLLFYKDLLSSDFELEIFSRPNEFLNALDSQNFDCILLDIYIPEMDGFALLETIRQKAQYSRAPIFLITSNPNDKVKIQSYQNGASDFFDRMERKDELIARVGSKIKAFRENRNFIKINNLSLDLHKIDCHLNERKVILTLIEFKILSRLMMIFPHKMSKEDLVKSIWENEVISANNLNSHLYNLRMKVEDWDYVIENHRNEGFYLALKS